MTAVNVGTAYAVYALRYEQFEKGVAVIKKGYAELSALASKQIPTPVMQAPRAGDALPQVKKQATEAAGAVSKLEREQRALADSQIRAAAAFRDYDKALELVDAELKRAGDDTLRYNNLMAKQAVLARGKVGAPLRVQVVDTAPAAPEKKGRQEGGLQGLVAAGNARAAKLIEPAALLEMGVELTKLGTQVQRVGASFDTLTKNAGQSGPQILKALRAASGNEIDDLNLKLAANRGITLGVAQSADEFTKLMTLARSRAQDFGTTTEKAFDDLVTGLGRASPQILDNLGITVDVTKANEDYAKALGKTSKELTDAEQKQALINQVLAQGANSTKANADNVVAAQVAWENFKQTLASFVVQAGEPVAGVLAKVGQFSAGSLAALSGSGAKDFAAENIASSPAIKAATDALKELNEVGGAAIERNKLHAATITRLIDDNKARTLAIYEEVKAGTLQGDALRARIDGVNRERDAIAGLAVQVQAQITDADRQAMTERNAAQAAKETAEARKKAFAERIEKDAEAKKEAEALAEMEKQLAKDSHLAALGMLSAGDQADALATKYGIAKDAAVGLIGEQKKILAQTKPGREEAEFRNMGDLKKSIDDAKAANAAAAAEAARAAFEAKKNQEFALASPAQRLKLEKEALSHLIPGTADYIDKQTDILQLQQQIAEDAKRAAEAAGKRGAAAAKAAEREENAEAKKLKAIQDDYSEHYKRLAEMRTDYDTERSRSAEDFAITERRLLAEGRILEARQAREDFERQQRRNEEDFQRNVAKEGEKFAANTAPASAIVARATGAAVPPSATVARAAGAAATPTGAAFAAGAAAAAQQPPTTIAVTIPIAVTMDGKTVAEITGPMITQPLLDDLALQVSITTAGRPIGGQQTAFREIG